MEIVSAKVGAFAKNKLFIAGAVVVVALAIFMRKKTTNQQVSSGSPDAMGSVPTYPDPNMSVGGQPQVSSQMFNDLQSQVQSTFKDMQGQYQDSMKAMQGQMMDYQKANTDYQKSNTDALSSMSTKYNDQLSHLGSQLSDQFQQAISHIQFTPPAPAYTQQPSYQSPVSGVTIPSSTAWAGLGNNGVGDQSQAKRILESGNAGVLADIERTKAVIANRQAAHEDTTEQTAWLASLHSHLH